MAGERGGRPRSALRRDHPARRDGRARRRRAHWRSRLRLAARAAGARSRRRTRGLAARRLLRAASGHAQSRAPLWREARAPRPRHGDRLSRALAFRRPGRAGERLSGSRPHRQRLAQPRRRAAALRRRREKAGLKRRRHGAARPARPGARARLGAAGPAQRLRRPRRPGARTLPPPRSRRWRAPCRPDSTPSAWRQRTG